MRANAFSYHQAFRIAEYGYVLGTQMHMRTFLLGCMQGKKLPRSCVLIDT